MPRNKQYRIAQEKRTKERSKTARPLNEEAVNSVLDKDNDTKTQKQKRTRRFCLTTYIDVTALNTFLKNAPWVQHFAYCTHDRDFNEDGTPKTLHTHLLLYTYDAKTSSAVKKIFDNYSAEYYRTLGLEAQNTLVQECHDMCSQYRYLMHLDDLNKARYNEDEVVTDNITYWHELCRTAGMTDSATNTGLQIVNEMLNGARTKELVAKYGKEYIYHNAHYKQILRDISYDDCLGISFEGLRDMCEFALSSSTYSQYDINKFLYMLEWVQTQFVNIEFNENVTKYLKA